MTEPIKIPYLNVKVTETGEAVPMTHADLPPAAGIANTMTVHEHITVLQRLQNAYNSLLDKHAELIINHEKLIDEHEALIAERSEPSKTDTATEFTAEAVTPEPEATASTSTEPVIEPVPASQPVVFTPKVPTPVSVPEGVTNATV